MHAADPGRAGCRMSRASTPVQKPLDCGLGSLRDTPIDDGAQMDGPVPAGPFGDSDFPDSAGAVSQRVGQQDLRLGPDDPPLIRHAEPPPAEPIATGTLAPKELAIFERGVEVVAVDDLVVVQAIAQQRPACATMRPGPHPKVNGHQTPPARGGAEGTGAGRRGPHGRASGAVQNPSRHSLADAAGSTCAGWGGAGLQYR